MNNSHKFDFENIKCQERTIKDIISYASTLYDLKEYSKCIYTLKNYANEKYPTAFFLYNFCEYLLILQKKQEEISENPDVGFKTNSSKELNKLLNSMKKSDFDFQNNPFCLYLYGTILKELDQKEEAKEIFINCLNIFPFLWGAWIDLCMISKQNDYVIFF